MANLKTKVDNFDERKTVTADSSNLRNIVDNDVAKETVYNKLVIKVNAIDTKALSN